jgi:hypothetical protein
VCSFVILVERPDGKESIEEEYIRRRRNGRRRVTDGRRRGERTDRLSSSRREREMGGSRVRVRWQSNASKMCFLLMTLGQRPSSSRATTYIPKHQLTSGSRNCWQKGRQREQDAAAAAARPTHQPHMPTDASLLLWAKIYSWGK